METRKEHEMKAVESRPARLLLEKFKSINAEHEIIFKDEKLARTKAKSKLDALLHAYHLLTMQILADEVTKPAFIMSEDMINMQCKSMSEKLDAETDLKNIASGATIKHWEDEATNTLLALRNTQLSYLKRMEANTIDLYRQLREADGLLSLQKIKLEKAKRSFLPNKKASHAAEAEISRLKRVIEDLEVTLHEHHEHPKVKELQKSYDELVAKVKYLTDHQEEMRQAAYEKLNVKQLEHQKVMDYLNDSEMRYYSTLKPATMQNLVRLYQVYCEFQQAAMPELKAKYKASAFADYSKKVEANNAYLSSLMQKLWCDAPVNKNAATIHSELKTTPENKAKTASVVPVAMFKPVAAETLEKRKYLKRDPTTTHHHAVFKL